MCASLFNRARVDTRSTCNFIFIIRSSIETRINIGFVGYKKKVKEKEFKLKENLIDYFANLSFLNVFYC